MYDMESNPPNFEDVICAVLRSLPCDVTDDPRFLRNQAALLHFQGHIMQLFWEELEALTEDDYDLDVMDTIAAQRVQAMQAKHHA